MSATQPIIRLPAYDPMVPLNRQIAEAAHRRGWRIKRLEDGERVFYLRGKRGAHAGAWGSQTWYILIPDLHPTRRTNLLMAAFPTLKNRSSDAEVLVLGPPILIEEILANGPLWVRARKRRPPSDPSSLLAASVRLSRQAAELPTEAGLPA